MEIHCQKMVKIVVALNKVLKNEQVSILFSKEGVTYRHKFRSSSKFNVVNEMDYNSFLVNFSEEILELYDRGLLGFLNEDEYKEIKSHA